ncbi:MAG: dipicolinate synthase subunit B [Oscillospiraceae bacterium]|jgi:dipicolinate synthase subunit B|nr:dipicolinate synthase subunit B [Oscillospiraceae bacterium]
MGLEQTRVGVGLTGSFCTCDEVLDALEAIAADYTFVLSYHAQQLSSRFGTPEDFERRLRALTAHMIVKTIPEAEPLGPKNLLDVFVIAPCTGNTLAKLANGITDTPVLMAAKGHLRNGKPLVISLASNDALGVNLRNIGTLLNMKHISFVPFAQDAPQQKPNSLTARTELLGKTIEAALRGEQLQPVLR